jgi:1-aminocyclopropane-1-carboxylate deaminase
LALEDFNRFPLLIGPSPIQKLDRLTKHLGRAHWAKREDLNSGYAFGGNKTRKLKYLVADAIAQGCDTLVSIGGVQSNHTRMVAGAAAAAGLKAVLVQESWVDWPDVTYDRVGNILLSRLMGADVRLVKAGFGIGFKESWEQALADVVAGGGKPYAIPAGASDHPLGGLGFASWAREVEVRRPSSACSSTRSWSARSRAPRRPAWSRASPIEDRAGERRVYGIDASAKPDETRAATLKIARFTADAIGLGRQIRDDEVILDEHHHAGI